MKMSKMQIFVIAAAYVFAVLGVAAITWGFLMNTRVGFGGFVTLGLGILVISTSRLTACHCCPGGWMHHRGCPNSRLISDATRNERSRQYYQGYEEFMDAPGADPLPGTYSNSFMLGAAHAKKDLTCRWTNVSVH